MVGFVLHVLLCTTCWVAAGASEARAQDLQATRTLYLTHEELRGVLTNLFEAVGTQEDRSVQHVMAVVDHLGGGDKAELWFFTSINGGGELFVDVYRDVYFRTAVRSTGTALDSAESVFRRHALAMLKPIEGRIFVALDDGVVDGALRPGVTLRTALEYPCTGYTIEADMAEEDGNLRFTLHGIMAPRFSCGLSFTPARAWRPAPIDAGEYDLRLVHDDQLDRYRLSITDSSAQLVPVRTSFSEADTAVHWRRPQSSFDVTCRPGTMWCAEFVQWLQRVDGFEQRQFPSYGVSPYRPAQPGHTYYRYRSPEMRSLLEACMAAIREAAPPGVSISVQEWNGRMLIAFSRAGETLHIATQYALPAVCG